MANPRKFSEKIALLNQKQAEGNAQFEQVMKEVSDATKRVGQNHLRISQTPLGSFRGGSLPNVANAAIEIKTDQPIALSNLEELKKCGRADTPVTYRERGRSLGVGPMRSRPAEKRIDTSPYSSGPYLSPPPDSSWRRTNSDSALHQSTMCGDSTPRRSSHHHDSHQQTSRSSVYDKSHASSNIYPSQYDSGCLQIPMNNNTGSLPDLTNFYLPPPLPTPLDQEDNSSTSPQGTSSQSFPTTRFNYRPPSNPNAQPHSPAQVRRTFYTQDIDSLIGGPHSPSQSTPLQLNCEDGSLYNHLSHQPLINSNYLHHNKVVTQEQSVMDDFSRANCSLSPQPDQSTAHTYRSPQPSRPSPQNSPGLTVPYRSASPGDSHNSAPPSPVSPASSPASHHFTEGNYYYSQAQALQQHFEHFNMQESPSSPCIMYIQSPNSTTITQGMSPEDGSGQEGATDPGYYSTSPSQMQFGKQQTTPQTPNTPSSIPDITLTDFSSAPDDLVKHELVNDLGSATFDSDLFPSDESLREGLGQIDFAGFQMLTDPDMVIRDPSAEEHFRLDRL